MNLLNLTAVTIETSVQAVPTSPTAIVANPAASGKVIKVTALYISNVDGVGSADITIDLFRNSTAYHIASAIEVIGNTTIDVISKSIYLKEGDSLRLTASTAGDLQAVCSYEELS
jgi:hypothetical protein